jgi:hypothetical protein
MDDVLVASVSGKAMKLDANDSVYFDFAFFSGGSGPNYAPEHDSYARHGSVRFYNVAANGGAGGGGGGGNGGGTPTEPSERFSLAVDETKIFQAVFRDAYSYPPRDLTAGGPVIWKLDPNLVSWGAGMDANFQGIQVRGRTLGKATLIATDPGTGTVTEPITVEVTQTPHVEQINSGVCTVEPLPHITETHTTKWSDDPPGKP